ncbi:MAG TPA: alpha/beta hydrolase, partial [Rhodanobacter sp.]
MFKLSRVYVVMALCVFAQAAFAAPPTPAARFANDVGIAPACASAKKGKLDEEGYVVIGGIEQWVTVKGDSCANPIILFISGGPGNPLSPYSDAVYGAWSKDFTLVQWDQRGAGMTYGRSPPAAGAVLTLRQMSDDGNELAAYLARRYNKKKVILWGSSWGSILGVTMAKAHPELFYAYLGTSQLVSNRENEAISYAGLLALARAADDKAALAVLE